MRCAKPCARAIRPTQKEPDPERTHLSGTVDVLMLWHHRIRCYGRSVRTTLDIDPVILNAAKDLAAQSRRSIGAVISELAQRGLEAGRAQAADGLRNGFPVFSVTPGTPPATSETVKQLLADEDLPAPSTKTVFIG